MASSSHYAALSLEQVLEDLSSRFIVNLPAEELESIERICFQIEQAHWYYEDFVRPQAPHLASYSLRKFSELVFRTCPLLSDLDATHAYDTFLQYKERVPVCGAILLSSNWQKCLVVKGWKANASWSFPRGKINHEEAERDCCVREVWEETGYDVSPHFNPDILPHPQESTIAPPTLPPGHYADDDFLEIMMKEQRIRMYIVPGVPEDTLFEPKTRKEISRIAWLALTDLPAWSKKGKAKKDMKCYMVTPFVAPLKKWISDRKAHPAKSREAVQSVEPEHVVDLEQESKELQALFFGAGVPVQPRTPPIYEPSAKAAAKSPQRGSVASQAQAAASDGVSADTRSSILIQMMISGSSYDLGPAAPSPSPTAYPTAVSALSKPPDPGPRAAASRTVAMSEEEREAARDDILALLRSQFSVEPSPPSPSPVEEAASPAQDVLALSQAQMQTSPPGRVFKSDMRLSNAAMQRLQAESPDPAISAMRPVQASNTISLLSLLNASAAPTVPQPQALLSLLNSRSPADAGHLFHQQRQSTEPPILPKAFVDGTRLREFQQLTGQTGARL